MKFEKNILCTVRQAPSVVWVPSLAQQRDIETGKCTPETVDEGLPYVEFRKFFDGSGGEVHDYRFSPVLLANRQT